MKPRTNGHVCPGCVEWGERYDRLLGEVLAMKREGFVPPQVVGDFAPPEQLEPDIREALRMFGIGSSTYREQEKLAWDMKRAGEAPELIAAKITAGERVEL